MGDDPVHQAPLQGGGADIDERGKVSLATVDEDASYEAPAEKEASDA
ncbi:hypothetical protein [Gordonia sp. NPDC003950]